MKFLRVHSLVTTVFFFSSLTAFSQENEIGIWGGESHSFGDINNTIKSIQFAKPAGGIFYRYNFNPRLAWYIGLSGGSTYGEDAISKDPYQMLRNLNYKTILIDAANRFEFNFFSLNRNKPAEWFSPFIFAGIDVYYFNPQAYYQGQWIDLKPLGTEGQQFPELTNNNPYHRVQVGIPLGGGFKFALNKNWTVGIECDWHKLFTDYLDDVSTVYADQSILATGDNGELAVALADRSVELQDVNPLGQPGKQRGDSYHKDAFVYAGIFISYSLVPLKCPSPGGKGF